MTELLPYLSLRHTRANITALITTLALIALTVLCGIHTPIPAAHAAPTNSGTSSDNAITVTTTATPDSIPPGGSQVSMAYTVTNNTAERAYLVSMLDNKCPAVRQTSGLKTDSIRWYIEPGKTANFSCNFFAGIALDATITATFTTYNTTNTWHESNAQATTTVTLTTNQCDTLWYSSLLNNSDTGRIGTLGTQPTSAMQPRWTISQLTNSAYDSSAALDVNPANPNHIYFIPSKAGNSYGGLWRLDTTTGTATRITTNTTATTSVRLATDRNGTLWSWATNGILYSLAPGTTTWTAHTLTAASSTDGKTTLTADQIKNLGAGDLVTSGNGDLWLLAANTGTNTTYLLSINANESTKPTPTPVIAGLMNRPTDGGYYNGLAFSSTGKLLASAGAASSTTATNTLYEVDIATGQATRISAAPSAGNGSIGDLGSCAQPLSRLHLIKRADTPNPAVKPGDTITYEIEARNLGGLAAVDVRLQESIPAGTTYLPGSTTLNGIKIADTNGTMPYTNTREIHANNTTRAGIIPAFSTATIRFTVTVNDTSPQATSITNQATLTSTNYTNGLLSDDPSAPGTTDPTSVRIARPAITIDKTANTPAITGSGPITYTYTVANIGAEPLAGITLTDNATRGTTPITPYTCTSPTLTNGDTNKDTILDIYETWTYTCTDTLTWRTTDTDNGTTITNTATITGTGETSGATVTSTSALTTALKPQPTYINITKQPGTVVGPDSDTGEMVASYSVLVSNTGQANGSYSTLTDTPTPPAGMKITAVEWVRLDGDTTTGSGTAPSDGNGGYLLNTTPRPLPGGATERYRVRVRLLWTNSTVPPLTCDQGSGIRNTATLPTGEENATTNDNTTCLDAPHPPQPAIALVKTGTPPAAATVGSTIPYTFTVTNNSPNIFLTDLTITDPLISDITCDNNRLPAGTTTTCRGNYTITTTDLNAGKITNTATASALPAGFDPTNRITTTATNTLPVNSTAALTLNKTATAQDLSALTTNAAVGDRITYTFTITNSGNKTLHQPTIDDPILGITNKPCGTGDLAIGDTTSCTATYALTKADIDRGRLTNIATATALGTAGGTDDPAPITDSATATLTGIAGKTGLWLEKSQLGTVIDADNSGDHSAGDTLWYTFRVRNLTTATITGITVTDTKAGSTVTCDETTLEVGASTACRLSNPYRITTADLTAGKVINVATATADGGLTSNQPSVTTPLTYNPTLTLTKIAGALTEATITPDTPAGPSKGDTVTYSFTVTNPTALPMTNLTITDPLLPSITCTNPTGATTTIQARETLTCTATTPYTITRPDIDARHITNTATATATPAQGTLTPPTASTTTPLIPLPRLSITKTHTGPPNGSINLGDTITYTITLTNEGAGTLRNLTITDPMLGLDHAWCQEATTTLAPGASITCTTPTHTVTQRELDLLGATNTATGHALSGSDATLALLEATTTDTFTTITPTGKLTVTKHFDQLDDTDNSATPTPGDLLHYRFVVTNTGNATLRFLTIDDATIQMNSYACGNIDIAPGASTTCLAPVHTLTNSDITNGTTITNTATATAITYHGDIITGHDTNITNLATAPRTSLTLTKTAQLDHDPNHNNLADPNDTARYTFTATNTGTTTINNLAIHDPMLQGVKTTVTCVETVLTPSRATTCTTDTPMTITPENITPFITPGTHTLPNTAAAHGTTPPEPTTGKPALDVFSPPARATIPLVDALIATPTPPAPPTDPNTPTPAPTDPPTATPTPNQPTPTPSPIAPLPPLPEDGPKNPPNSPGHQYRPQCPTPDPTSTNPSIIPPQNIIIGPAHRWGKGNAEGTPSSAWHLPTPGPTWRTGHVSPHTTAVPNTTSAHHQPTAETRPEPPLAATLLTLIVASGAITYILRNRRKRTRP